MRMEINSPEIAETLEIRRPETSPEENQWTTMSESLSLSLSISSSNSASDNHRDRHSSTESLSLKRKPHTKSNNDNCWNAIQSVTSQRDLGPSDFTFFRPELGRGDTGTVYLVRLTQTPCNFAIKAMDKRQLQKRNKMERSLTELAILLELDHPFLPTLYAHFETRNALLYVIDFCSGGDLHSLLQRCCSFSLSAMRFYAAEVLVALEYLHMVGIIYRDLKPENVMIRQDGHIMLSDFDLSRRCNTSPKLVNLRNPSRSAFGRKTQRRIRHKRSFSLSSLVCGSVPTSTKTRQNHCLPLLRSFCSSSSPSALARASKLLVAEPLGRSTSFVGTYDYLAPEMLEERGHHGSAVDWWAFGVLMYELLYGCPPFYADTPEKTMQSVTNDALVFPTDNDAGSEADMHRAKDLISRLLVKDPSKRLGSKQGASDIKFHEFFDGVDWVLVRSLPPPFVPCPFDDSAFESLPFLPLFLDVEEEDDYKDAVTDADGYL